MQVALRDIFINAAEGRHRVSLLLEEGGAKRRVMVPVCEDKAKHKAATASFTQSR